MAFILNIHTATERALVSIAENEKVIVVAENQQQKDHAAFLHVAIQDLLQKSGIPINMLAAVAVTSGPGSYTGLRVGMAAAKGLCYALNVPMITLNTLAVMAQSCIIQVQDKEAMYCPLIDARRMEVFTAVYDTSLTAIVDPCAMLLDSSSFNELLASNTIYFSGSGAPKLEAVLNHENAHFTSQPLIPAAMAELSYKNFLKKNFVDILYASPVYLKEFYTPAKRAT